MPVTDDPGPALAAELARALGGLPDGPLGVAVSGGGDSVALLLLLQDWAAGAGRTLAAATVDHGLRPGSRAEAEGVAALCAARGVAHEVLTWGGWDGRGNLQDRARRARRALLADWARAAGLVGVALAHTQDDQAETFLIRLARGSGVDGLAAMAPAVEADGVLWLRPLLGVPRADLRRYLTARGVSWIEDPSNADPDFARTHARAALAPLAALGIGPARLAATAGALGRARAALEQATAELAHACLVAGPAGDAALDPGPFAAAPEELQLRLLAGALMWVAGASYRPRLESLQAVRAAIDAGRIGCGQTLHGCTLRARAGRIWLRREPARVAPPVPLAVGRWDNRWELVGEPGSQPESAPGLAIGALGTSGLAARPHWRASGLAREALLTTPAIWRENELVAAPLLGEYGTWKFRRISCSASPWRGKGLTSLALNPRREGLC